MGTYTDRQTDRQTDRKIERLTDSSNIGSQESSTYWHTDMCNYRLPQTSQNVQCNVTSSLDMPRLLLRLKHLQLRIFLNHNVLWYWIKQKQITFSNTYTILKIMLHFDFETLPTKVFCIFNIMCSFNLTYSQQAVPLTTLTLLSPFKLISQSIAASLQTSSATTVDDGFTSLY